jgi:O-antigen/teichoic acid export membrane protein
MVNVRSLANQSALYGLAGAIGKALALLTVPVLTRILTPREYGVADLATALAAMLVILAMFGGDIAASRLAAPADERHRVTILSSYFWAVCVAGIVIALALLPFSGVIAEGIWFDAGQASVAFLAILLIPLSAAQASLTMTLRIRQFAVPYALLQGLDLLGQMLLAVAFVAVGLGAFGMLLGFVIGSALGLLGAAAYCRDVVRTRPNWRVGRAMFLEGLPFLPASLAFVISSYSVRFLLTEAHGQAGVGLLAVATRLAGGIDLLAAAFALAWGPIGLALTASAATARLYGRVLYGFVAVSFASGIIVSALGPEVITLISGSSYIGAASMLPGLMAGAALAGAFYVLLVAAGITGRGRSVAFAAVSGAAIQVLATAILLPALGFPAIGASATIGQGVALILLARVVGSQIYGTSGALALMFAGSVAMVGLGWLNLTPSETLVFRLLLAAMAALLGGLTVGRILSRQRLADAVPT